MRKKLFGCPDTHPKEFVLQWKQRLMAASVLVAYLCFATLWFYVCLCARRQMFEHTQDQNVTIVASKIVDLGAAHLISGVTTALKRFTHPLQRHSDKCSSSTMHDVCSRKHHRRKSNVQKWTEPQRRPADDVTAPNTTSAVSLKDFHMFHVFVISLLLLFFFCSTERFLPLLCNVTLITSLSDKAAVVNANDSSSFCLMTGSLGFPWRSSSSALSLWDFHSFLRLSVFFMCGLLFQSFIASRSFFHSLYDGLPRRPPSSQRDGQIVVWAEVC